MPRPTDIDWLRAQVDEGRSAAAIADEVGCTARDVRTILRDNAIALPGQRRIAHVDWHHVEHDWRKGYPVATIARLYAITEHQLVYRMRHVPRTPRPQQRPSKYPALNDPARLRITLALGRTVADIARDAGCAPRVVVAALRRHDIVVPPRRATRLERIRNLHDPVERAEAAAALAADARAEAREAATIRTLALRQQRRTR